MNTFKKERKWSAAFLVFVLVWLIPLFGYTQQLQNQPNIPRQLLQKLQGPQALKQRLLAQRAKVTKVQSPVDKSKIYDELRDKVRKHGSVNVIVTFNIPDLPDPTRMDKKDRPQAEQARKETIANAQEKLLKRMKKHNIKIHSKAGYFPDMSMTVNAAALEDLITNSDVSGIGENRINRPKLPQSVPLIGADQSWSKGFTGSGYTIAILDTGVDSTHPFLSGKVDAEACFSTNNSGTDPVYGPWTETTLCPNGLTSQTGTGAGTSCSIDGCDHGTHVAGIAAGHEYSGISFSGVAKDTHIIPIQVFSQATGTAICTVDPLHPDPGPCIVAMDSDIHNGLAQVLALKDTYNIAAVNLSLGSGQYDHICDYDDDASMAYKTRIDSLRNAGIATVVASGNESFTNATDSPACISSAISVGATTKYDTVPNYSNSVSFLSLLAPGGDGSGGIGDIWSSVLGGQFDYMAGTSMAAPHVAGAFAVLKQQSPTANVDDILSILQSTGVDVLDTRNNITKSRIMLANTPWVAHYNGPGSINAPTAIATDIAGNVYVTGLSCPDETCSRFDYATIKYSPLGAQQWVRRYSGGVYSAAFALAVDSQGSVYVAGYVCQYIDSTYNCGHADYVTIKYDTDGNQLWTATYNEGDISWPTAINVDTSGHAYVTGISCAGINCFRSSNPGDNITAYATVKYDTNGNQVWTKRYGYTQGYDLANALALDGSGNVYVTGLSCSLFDSLQIDCYAWDVATIKYDIYGNQLWVARYPDMWGEGIAVDSSGAVYITGGVSSSDGGYITVKYDSNNGNQLWVVPYGMSGVARDIAVDGSGNVYVTGDTLDPTFSFDEYATVKYDTNGNQLWVAIYSDFGSADATHVAVDTAENVYVTGNEGMGNYVTLKYDSNGNKVWMARQFGSHGGDNPALSVHGGNVYITGLGCTNSICNHYDYLTLMYTP